MAELAAKRLGILHELIPAARRVGVLIDPTYPSAESEQHDVETAARSIGLEINVLNASSSREIDTQTRTVPIVFPVIGDPVAAGFVESLARPGGSATGFMSTEYGMAGKYLELLKEIAPGVTRVAVLRNPATPIGPAQFGVIQAAAPSLRVEVNPVNVRDADEIERAVVAFAHGSNDGLIVAGSALTSRHRDLIITLAARHKLPAVYVERYYVAAGGLISYGHDFVDQYRRAAGYVDRILRGEKPANLPVQAPTRYELVINVQTAKALGLTIPPMLLARADEVIE